MVKSNHMSKIHRLSQEVINKIAAGEVVERPASVVKELMDNAYDALSTNITVEIENGGIDKIKVIDNGVGMSEEDAILCFERHATSKINTEDDILNIKTYGFRGEALSSISAISQVTLKTRRGEDQLGTEIKIDGGELTRHEKTGAQTGTSITVENLFFNVPARKEFLKQPQSEYKEILQIVNYYAIANPKVGLTLINNGKVVYSLPKDHLMEDRVREILGNDNYNSMIPIFYEHPHIELYGYIGKPEISSDRKKFQYIFVNKRAIENKSIAYAVKESYSSLIPKNNYPIFVIFIDIAPNTVDVNVHPRKEEVKFSNEKLVFEAVNTACKKALEKYNLTPGAAQKETNPFGSFPTPPLGAGPKPFGTSSYGSSLGTSAFGNRATNNATTAPRSPFAQRTQFGQMGSQLGQTPKSDPFAPKPPTPLPFGKSPSFASDKPLQPTKFDDGFDFNDDFDLFGKPEEKATQQNFSKRKILLVHNLYIIEESQDGIFIYDQHALHERILFDQFKKEYNAEKDKKSTQKLIAPLILNLSVNENETVRQNMQYFRRLGFELEDFGPNSYKVIEVPAVLVEKDIKKIIADLIADLENHALLSPKEDFEDKILAFLACRTAYKAGDVIPVEEVNAMIDNLEKTDIKYTCPHGRPLKVEITNDEMEKMFKRK